MSQWSISFSYRLGLGFHALNNEGADGSNLMLPRRIDVGKLTYDGISGEIIRHHILENFVNVCNSQTPRIEMLPLSEGLHPDRGPIGILAAARNGRTKAQKLNSENLFPSVREAIKRCAVLDVGGFLAAWKEEKSSDGEVSNSSEKKKKGYVAEKDYLERNCDTIGDVDPVKRESCFDVAWLISEEPQDSTITQHSSYRDTASLNMRYSQTMRSNVYGGVIRADLHRVGTDDYWYLQNDATRQIEGIDTTQRQLALVEAIVNFIASPTGAKTAGWAPHVFLCEGAILLSSVRTAPFVSPIKVNVKEEKTPVSFNSAYQTEMGKLKNDSDTRVWPFKDVNELLSSLTEIKQQIEGKGNGQASEETKKS